LGLLNMPAQTQDLSAIVHLGANDASRTVTARGPGFFCF
jgi:hypothetical protein